MGNFKKVIISVQNEISAYESYLQKAKNVELTIPVVQRKIEDAEFRLKIISLIPEDVGEEIASDLLDAQLPNEIHVSSTLPDLPIFDVYQVNSDSDTSGSASAFSSTITSITRTFDFGSDEIKWVKDVSATIDSYANKVAQREYLPDRLNLLYPTLGEAFNIALKSIDNCKAGTLGVNLGAMQLRDILNQIWGNLIDKVRNVNATSEIKTSNLEMKKSSDRTLVAEILAPEGYKKFKLSNSLDLLYDLYTKLSDTNFGKNPLSKDLVKLLSYYDQWILLIDDITGIVCI